ncbi:MAG: helicase-related protein [Alphaproteobacteria bacterium]
MTEISEKPVRKGANASRMARLDDLFLPRFTLMPATSSHDTSGAFAAARSSARSSAQVTVVLGPTNTGKTHLAMERMTGYSTGLIGFPLRLLARENYDRLVAQLGPAKVGLITGEERILPPSARYICATVESMPLDMGEASSANGRLDSGATRDSWVNRGFEFIAVDEVQLAGDRERGHVFTDRILNARGQFETMFMGADTAAPLLRLLLPEAKFETRHRMSRLSYAGPKKLTRLPRRSAIVAFGVADVYQLAETIRRQRGGAAVVMGRLSPRTRNAQVELYQNGDVDFLIATDAIGMGLNLDLKHVALASDVKFDGRHMRKLSPAEMAQIAGRAGRHVNDGTFGVTDGCRALEPEMIEAIEQHRFQPLRSMYWRNSKLDFSSVDALLASLEAPPPLAFLFRKGDALDHQALAALAARPDIMRVTSNAKAVRLLWEVACIPDFRQTLNENHYDMLANIYTTLVADGVLGADMVSRAMDHLDRLDGDLDTLMTRLAYIRTWTYITHRSDWTDNPAQWQDRARLVEDRLSDCLHARLSERFVDRRAAHLSRRLKENKNLMASVKTDGTVLVEGEEVGVLDGFVFQPTLAEGEEKSTILAAARRGLPDEIENRVRAFTASASPAFRLDEGGVISWRESKVARLVRGDGLYAPRAELVDSDLLSIDQAQRLNERLSKFVGEHVRDVLGRLMALEAPQPLAPAAARPASTPAESVPADAGPSDQDGPTKDEIAANPPTEQPDVVEAPDLASDPEPVPFSGAAKGIAFTLFEQLGAVRSADVGQLVRSLSDTDKSGLARLGVRFGVETVYLPDMLKPAPIALRALLWNLFVNDAADFKAAPAAGRVTIDAVDDVPDAFWLAVGYRRLGGRVMRVDMVERVALLMRNAAREGRFKISEDMMSLAGATRDQMAAMLLDLQCRVVDEEPSEDPEKPAIQIFERIRRPRQQSGGRGKADAANGKGNDGRGNDGAGRRPGGKKPDGRPSNKSNRKARGKPPGQAHGQGHSKRTAEKQPDPNSPFAVLAGLKLKD